MLWAIERVAQAGIAVQGLVKRLGGRRVLDEVGLEVRPGEVVGLLGPNGAGKTTTLRLLAGLYAPDAGDGWVAGEALRAGRLPGSALRARVGLLTEAPGLYPRLTARENLLAFGALYGARGQVSGSLEARTDALLERFGLASHAGKRAAALSRGMRQKVAIARAVLHEPEVVLLDEPTVGLDPESVGALRTLVQELAAEGRAVLLCSHLLDEVERLCERVVFLARSVVGEHRVAADPRCVTVGLATPAQSGKALATARALSFVERAERAGDGLEVRLAAAEDGSELIARLAAAGVRLRSVVPAKTSLESAYLRLLERARREGLLT